MQMAVGTRRDVSSTPNVAERGSGRHLGTGDDTAGSEQHRRWVAQMGVLEIADVGNRQDYLVPIT